MVGASNTYIMLPFLLESLIAAVGGALLACLTLAAVQQFVIVGKAQVEIQTIRWIEWSNVGWAMAIIGVVAIVLSVIPTLLATRRFLRV